MTRRLSFFKSTALLFRSGGIEFVTELASGVRTLATFDYADPHLFEQLAAYLDQFGISLTVLST